MRLHTLCSLFFFTFSNLVTLNFLLFLTLCSATAMTTALMQKIILTKLSSCQFQYVLLIIPLPFFFFFFLFLLDLVHFCTTSVYFLLILFFFFFFSSSLFNSICYSILPCLVAFKNYICLTILMFEI